MSRPHADGRAGTLLYWQSLRTPSSKSGTPCGNPPNAGELPVGTALGTLFRSLYTNKPSTIQFDASHPVRGHLWATHCHQDILLGAVRSVNVLRERNGARVRSTKAKIKGIRQSERAELTSGQDLHCPGHHGRPWATSDFTRARPPPRPKLNCNRYYATVLTCQPGDVRAPTEQQ